jgi:hypothetical protein
MIATLLLLLVVWLHALYEAEQVKALRRMAKIFEQAFDRTITATDEDIIVDKQRGEITLKAEQLFTTGDWHFKPTEESRDDFVRIRSKIAALLEEIDRGFRGSRDAKGLDARDHVEVRVIGHTDCQAYLGSSGSIEDNLDLSVLRAAAVARFLTEPCRDKSYRCCPDGSPNGCSVVDMSLRVSDEWKVIPMGRSYYEPRQLKKQTERFTEENCGAFSTEELTNQRRVVIQIVPRLDKFVIRDLDESHRRHGHATPSP